MIQTEAAIHKNMEHSYLYSEKLPVRKFTFSKAVKVKINV